MARLQKDVLLVSSRWKSWLSAQEPNFPRKKMVWVQFKNRPLSSKIWAAKPNFPRKKFGLGLKNHFFLGKRWFGQGKQKSIFLESGRIISQTFFFLGFGSKSSVFLGKGWLFSPHPSFSLGKLVFQSKTEFFLAKGVYFICCLRYEVVLPKTFFECHYYWDSIPLSIIKHCTTDNTGRCSDQRWGK